MRIDQTNVLRLRRPLDRASGGHPDVVITCDCGRTDFITAKGNTPSECVAQRFRHRGWVVDQDGRKAQCRDCHMKNKSNGVMPSSDAVRSQVAIVRLLDEYFDVDAGRYADGWSDEAIANEKGVGLSVDAVVQLRETAYGPPVLIA